MGQGYLLLGADVADAVPRALRRVLPWAASTEPTIVTVGPSVLLDSKSKNHESHRVLVSPTFCHKCIRDSARGLAADPRRPHQGTQAMPRNSGVGCL